MQYELALIALTAFGGLLLVTLVYKNRQAINAIKDELAEWGKEIEKE